MRDVIAVKAVLSMLLEVSANPKPGNVDREHDFEDTRYEHFITSAASCYPVFLEMVGKREGLGMWIRKLVGASRSLRGGGNTHLGTFIIMSPLVMSADDARIFEVASEIVKRSTPEDAVNLYLAIRESGAYLPPSEELSVFDDESLKRIEDERITLYDILSISSSYDMISDELVNGFRRVRRYSEILRDFWNYGVNEAIVRTYIRMLSEEEDSFIRNKHGPLVAEEVRRKAEEVFRDFSIERLREFDEMLLERRINPGSSADIICGAIFINLLGGARVD
ncbi:MAG: triphosphoribosyl-dephospho-CoA synthase [Archaeoglobi archaeon]|nr:triphosphoribosyl-dephospho-CoA synthase [Archaeoglobi archaeon]MDK2781377.1 triphosphoribosyl-dephospho-CoA synthase [Archaeoglobi archaeon]